MKEQSEIDKIIDHVCFKFLCRLQLLQNCGNDHIYCRERAQELKEKLKSAILKDRRELVEKAIEMARENNEGVEITICPEMKYTQQQILEKLEVRDV
jgi:biotin synthase-like enzyme